MLDKRSYGLKPANKQQIKLYARVNKQAATSDQQNINFLFDYNHNQNIIKQRFFL